MANVIQWTCIGCKQVLGEVIGGELKVLTPEGLARTRGVNLALTCPYCGMEKTWYASDPIVRAIYQLVDAVVGVAAKRMVEVAGRELMRQLKQESAEKNTE